METILQMKGIKKSFGHNTVLRDVDLTIHRGSIHALLGENGTGKSTLMNILTGLIPDDGGEIVLTKGVKITFIHQELSLVNDLTVYENLFLGHEIIKHGFMDRKTMIQQSKAALNRIGVRLDPAALVKDLGPSEKQIVEITRALLQNNDLIIMDEPTSSLTDVEIDHLFEVMKQLSQQGISIIFISHKLQEVLKVCDEYTVMRDGRVVLDGQLTKDVSEDQLIEAMVGKKLNAMNKRERLIKTDDVLALRDLSKQDEFEDINLHIRKGEIVGITGLLGDGKSNLFATVAGANYPYQGQIVVDGKVTNMKNTAKAVARGISYLPKNRKENGIIPGLSINDNLLLTILRHLSKGGILSNDRQRLAFQKYSKVFNIKYGQRRDHITTLSGGNQQKVILARALSTNPRIVILDNPTQGVDIGARSEIYEEIEQLSRQGVSFVVLSNEFNEINHICDRVYVMCRGKIVKEMLHQELDEEAVLRYAMGSASEKVD
ncbi:sugar ABC transporter ATP-binding protein [Limosilactobacillus difficilis]|uniref:sugar ABC transporter ATP-binding protein n=1 Tax=Limosilactobacillus difficilis TaxID=2991838 RepID=UPI0024BB786D|nr:sugar ABC transporter ATP-binding protein [Limosilactobacillus difficilis]